MALPGDAWGKRGPHVKFFLALMHVPSCSADESPTLLLGSSSFFVLFHYMILILHLLGKHMILEKLSVLYGYKTHMCEVSVCKPDGLVYQTLTVLGHSLTIPGIGCTLEHLVSKPQHLLSTNVGKMVGRTRN